MFDASRIRGPRSSQSIPEQGADAAAITAATASESSGLPTGWKFSRDEGLYIHDQSKHKQSERPYPLLPGWEHAIHQRGEKKGQLYYFNTVTKKKRNANDRPEDKPDSSASQSVGSRSPSAFESAIRTRYSNQALPSQHAISAEEEAYNQEAMAWFRGGKPQEDNRTYVDPNQTTRPGGSWGCERRAAAIDGSTIDFKKNDDIEAVCIRLLQTDKSALTYKAFASVEAFYALAHLSLLAFGDGNAFYKTLSAASVAGVGVILPPHVGVARQYSSVHQACQEYLANRFGQSFVDQLETLEFDKKGLNGVINLLSSHDPQIKTLKLEEQLRKLEKQDAKSTLRQLLSNLWENLYPAVHLDPERGSPS